MSANEANLPAISRGARALADKERSAPPPPLAPFYDGLAPLFLALKAAETIWNIVLRLKFDLDRPNGLSRNQALQALDDLQASGRLSRFHEAVAGARERANPGDIIGTLTAALSILSRACPPNFITGATYELGMIEASKGAVALAARDCVLAEDRRFRPPELCELIAAATKREEELSAHAGNLKFLMAWKRQPESMDRLSEWE